MVSFRRGGLAETVVVVVVVVGGDDGSIAGGIDMTELLATTCRDR
jgi:hypothetical protein